MNEVRETEAREREKVIFRGQSGGGGRLGQAPFLNRAKSRPKDPTGPFAFFPSRNYFSEVYIKNYVEWMNSQRVDLNYILFHSTFAL